MAEEPGKTPQTPNPEGKPLYTEAEYQEAQNRIAAKVRSEVKGQYGDYDKVKARLAELEKDKEAREEAEKSERQKEIDAAAKAARKEEAKLWEAKLGKQQLDTTIERELLKQGCKDPDVRLLMVGEFAPESAGDVPEKVTALLSAKDFLVDKAAAARPQGAGGTPPASGTAEFRGQRMTLTRGQLNEMRASGTWMGSPYQQADEKNILDITD